MSLKEIVFEKDVFMNQVFKSKHELLQFSARYLSGCLNQMSENELLERLEDRESMMSTGIGQGVAVPHIFLTTLKQTVGMIIHLESSLDFDSLDDEDISLAFILVGPRGETNVHLRLLAEIARIAKNEPRKKSIFDAKTASEIISLIGKGD